MNRNFLFAGLMVFGFSFFMLPFEVVSYLHWRQQLLAGNYQGYNSLPSVILLLLMTFVGPMFVALAFPEAKQEEPAESETSANGLPSTPTA